MCGDNGGVYLSRVAASFFFFFLVDQLLLYLFRVPVAHKAKAVSISQRGFGWQLVFHCILLFRRAGLGIGFWRVLSARVGVVFGVISFVIAVCGVCGLSLFVGWFGKSFVFLGDGSLWLSFHISMDILSVYKCYWESIHRLFEYDKDICVFFSSSKRPSLHRGFKPYEREERRRYEAAESVGQSGGDCDLAYADCAESPLDSITRLAGEHVFE